MLPGVRAADCVLDHAQQAMEIEDVGVREHAWRKRLHRRPLGIESIVPRMRKRKFWISCVQQLFIENPARILRRRKSNEMP